MTSSAIIEELAENFELLGDWDQRYEYIMDLGNRLGDLDASDKTDATKVHGCMSNVYIVGRLSDGAEPVIEYSAECDTAIIRGVIKILLMVYDKHTPAAALEIDADDLFDKLGLFEHLSPTRHVGVYALVERLRVIARDLGPTAH